MKLKSGIAMLALAAVGLLSAPVRANPFQVPEKLHEYAVLLDFIELEDRDHPLKPFDEFTDEFDERSHQASIAYFNTHPQLMERIKGDLEGKPIRWRLHTLEHRLVFVPEEREAYATLFENYCRDAVSYMLNGLEAENPYAEIRTLKGAKPVLYGNGAMRAYIVHNLVREYRATYIFSCNDCKRVAVDVGGYIYLGDVGSYTTDIYKDENGEFRFVNRNYTLWQNSARNAYTVLSVPVEETLHILLRECTQAGIKREIALKSIRDLGAVENIAHRWLALEEAVVGGIVHALLPPFLTRYLDGFQESLMEEDLVSKMAFDQYRHLTEGIALVERMGFRAAFELYCHDPAGIRSSGVP